MPRESSDVVGEVAELRKRFHLLASKVDRHRAEASRERILVAALSSGAVALFLSMALPWVRDGGGLGFSASEGAARSRPLGGYATGWDVFGAALGEPRWLYMLAFVALLVLFFFSLTCLKGTSKGMLVTTVVLSALTPVLYFLAWFPMLSDEAESAGSGVFVMVVACAAIGWAARESILDERFK
ncbi:hypothetical protein GCM10009642_08940 [Nocardiopsis metallicus]